MAQNLANLSPQQLQQLQTQATQQALQAPLQFGTEKLLINVNGQNSKLPTNKNGIIKYTLEQPVKLEVGDKITLVESFVEERGLSIDTISFEEDVEEEIRFLYYCQGDLRNTQNVKGVDPFTGVCADQEFAPFPSLYPDCFDSGVGFPSGGPLPQPGYLGFLGGDGKYAPYVMPGSNYEYGAPEANVDNRGAGVNVMSGANGQYYYMMEFFNPNSLLFDDSAAFWGMDSTFTQAFNGQFATACWFRPLYGAATIKIPAGNYSVSALSDLINNQLNGSATKGKPNIDKMMNKLYNTEQTPVNNNSTDTYPFFNGLNTLTNNKDELPPEEYNPDVKIIGEDKFQPFQRRRGDMVVEMLCNPRITANRINMRCMRTVPFANPAVNPQITWANPNETLSENQDGSGTPISDPPLLNAGILAASHVGTLLEDDIDNRVILRRNATNFYIHLDFLKSVFGGLPDGDPGKGQYYDIDYSPTGNDLATGKWNPRNFPNLSDIFAYRLGDKGLIYYDNNISEFNSAYQDDVFGGSGRPYFTQQVASMFGSLNYKYQCLFPVVSTSDNTDPQKDRPSQVAVLSQFGGTTSFELKYDTASANRFSILNLHEPYKLASRTPDNKSDTNVGGQQATVFNSPIVINNSGDQDEKFIAPFTNLISGIYPIDSAGGIAVNNFSFSTVKDTKVYKDLVADINSLNTSNASFQMAREKAIYELFTKPYDEFFDSEESAQEAWSSTFWNRLGFTYDQLGNVSSNLEEIFTFSPRSSQPPDLEYPRVIPRFIKQTGIITHNAFDYTFIPSSSGLGSGNPLANASASQNPQAYGLRAYTTGSNYNALSVTDEYGVFGNYINILANSQPINAFNFPSLNNGNNYLVIESDIVKTNAKDSNSNSTTIVGIMSKENATNDTIFSVNPVTFINTEPRLLSTIEVQIKNPDGTLVSDNVVGKNNGFVFQIEKAIKVADIASQSF